MKIKSGRLYDTMIILAQIMGQKRKMPQVGKYRLARLHAQLTPEFDLLNKARNEIIESYDTHQKISNPTREDPLGQNMIDGPLFIVPLEKAEDFAKRWGEIADVEIEISVDTIPISSFGDADDGPIEAVELVILGDLIKE